jgi:hypothetical protein
LNGGNKALNYGKKNGSIESESFRHGQLHDAGKKACVERLETA